MKLELMPVRCTVNRRAQQMARTATILLYAWLTPFAGYLATPLTSVFGSRRLSGNHLSHIPGQAFSGLHSLKIL